MEMKEAIVTSKGEVRCPYCGLLNAMLTGKEMVRGLKIRCRGSRRGTEHYFVLNALPDYGGKESA